MKGSGFAHNISVAVQMIEKTMIWSENPNITSQYLTHLILKSCDKSK